MLGCTWMKMEYIGTCWNGTGMATGVHCNGTEVASGCSAMILGYGGMVPRGVLGRSGLYWDVLGCPGIAVRHNMLTLRCSEKSLTQTGVECYALEQYWDGNGLCWNAQKWHRGALGRHRNDIEMHWDKLGYRGVALRWLEHVRETKEWTGEHWDRVEWY